MIKTDHIYHGDNVEVMRSFPDDCIDLVVTSPPYDNIRDYGGHGWDFELLAAELKRCLKPGGVIVWVVGDATINGSETGSSFRQALHFMDIGLRLHDTMIYHKSNHAPMNGNRYEPEFEYMFVISNGRPVNFNPLRDKKTYKDNRTEKKYHRNKNGNTFKIGQANKSDSKVRGNVWKVLVGGGKSYNANGAPKHPAIFPIKLAKDHIYSWSNPGDVVLDPFAGSGTTLKAAKELHRRYVGIEVHEPYVKVCRDRVRQEVLEFER